jgi:hypothetical protein
MVTVVKEMVGLELVGAKGALMLVSGYCALGRETVECEVKMAAL